MKNDLVTLRKVHDEDIDELETLFQVTRQETFASRPSDEFKIGDFKESTAKVVIFLEYFPDTLYKWFGDQIAKGGDASESATIMVDHNLKETTSFINGQGLLHFDAHFFNIMTDGHRLYFADFGLALSSRFELSKAELEFFEQH